MKQSHFAELLDAVSLRDDGVIAMLRAYFDASRLDNGILAIAGIAFGLDRAKSAERALRLIFGERYCHMTDLHNRKGAFEGIGDEEADRLCRGAIGIINEYASAHVAISCDVPAVEALGIREAKPQSTPLVDGFRHAYPCCLHWAMCAMGDVVGKQRNSGIAYWFELGDDFQGQARNFLSHIAKPDNKPLRDAYQHESDVFAPKEKAPLFGLADVLAWEWARHVSATGSGRQTRKSLAAVMNGHSCRTDQGIPFFKASNKYAIHYTGWPMDKFFDRLRRVMLSSSMDEMVAIRDETPAIRE